MINENAKRTIILDAASKVFAEKGYQYATIADIAKEAGISTGLTYSYFKNKLDVLLSIILQFLKRLNGLNQEQLNASDEPRKRLGVIVQNLEDLFIKDAKALYMVRVSSEALPHIVMIKEQELQKKRAEIIQHFNALFQTIDKTIDAGQRQGIFDDSLVPAVVRQTLLGAIERVVHGLFITSISGEEIGYDAESAHIAIKRLVDRFICK